jgi:hypothetical protein
MAAFVHDFDAPLTIEQVPRHLPPLAGAALQEGINLAVILNAMRAQSR